MKKLIPYLFIISLLASCKTTDRFSIHKRKYSNGFYIEKTGTVQTSYPVSGIKKVCRQIVPNSNPHFISGNSAVASNATKGEFSAIKKQVVRNPKTTFAGEQNNHLKEQKTVYLPQNPNRIQTKLINNKRGLDFLIFLQAFLLILVILTEVGCLGLGIYFITAAGSSNSVALGIKLLSIGLTFLVTFGYILLRHY